MDLATVMSIVQSLLATIQCCDQLFKDRSFSGYKSELESLQTTLNTVHAVLLDAEAKQDALSFQQKQYVEELRDAVYDADDVLDEFSTLVQRKKLILDGKVMSFLSQFRPLALNLSKKVKVVGKKLEGIASRKNQFSIDVNHQSTKFRKEESCSYVYTVDIIGRGPDLEKIVDMLLHSDTERDVSCLSVVGIGGLGKTALAQLVYNDERVKTAFPLKLWACVSDQDPNHLHLELVLRKILAEAMGKKNESSTYNDVQDQLRGFLANKKYLLVLDDVWNENHDEWMNLVGFLKGGDKGSCVLVTTRSKKTAEIIGNGPVYPLQGLLEEDSWRLFEKVAFDSTPTDDLVTIGKEIVKSCANVPLAIRAIGSLLYGESRSTWVAFQKNGLNNISEDKHNIKPILKLSYYHLNNPLKSCFAYCAVFPKGYTLYKKTLIRLWIAHGYIIPQKGQHIEDVGEEYFSVLVRRCFFQDVKKDREGDVYSCKMHDLMHDIAQELAGNEICIASDHSINVDEKVRHLSFRVGEPSEFSIGKTKLRTFLRFGNIRLCEPFPLGKLLTNCPCLRTLDLSHSGLECLPESIGKLLHLRWLNLSYNDELEVLPEAVKKLYNLQVLELSGCKSLKEWPKNISKLVNLRMLNNYECFGLRFMPLGLENLTVLETLNYLRVGYANGSRQVLEELEALKPLNNLKGSIDIVIGVPGNTKYPDNQEGGYLKHKQHLTHIEISFEEGEEYGKRKREYEEMLLDHLQPHPNLRKLVVSGYKGERMPRWLGEGLNPPSIHLPSLLSLEIAFCGELRSVSCLGRLPLLKKLSLWYLEVEYIVEDAGGGETSFSVFPSLEKLEVNHLPKLKGWWRRWSSSTPHLPVLKSLEIKDCKDFQMASIPSCPRLESLCITDSGNGVKLMNNFHYIWGCFSYIWVVSNLKLMANFKHLHIHRDRDVECFRGMNDWVKAIQTLEISDCERLRSVSGWIEHLHSLESLNIRNCPNLVRNNGGEEEDGIPWRHLPPTLRSLELCCFADMEEVLEGVKYCTSLHSLKIYNCPKLKSMPIWMPNLSFLTKLSVLFCGKLEERCQKFTGEDWHLIQHIPNIELLS